MPVLPKGLTPTERRIMDLLSDGGAHNKKEILSLCIDDDLAGLTTVKYHISNIRKKLAQGEAILCETNGQIFYRWVRLISSSEN